MNVPFCRDDASEAEYTTEMNPNEDHESEQLSDDDEEFSPNRRMTTRGNLSIKPNICPIKGCSSSFSLKRNLCAHIKTIHGCKQQDGQFGVVRFVCKLCKYTTQIKSNYGKHFKNNHPKKDSKENLIEKFIKTPPLEYK